MCQVSSGIDAVAATQVVFVTGLSITVRLRITVTSAIRCDTINFDRSIGFNSAIRTVRFCTIAHGMMAILFDGRTIGLRFNVAVQ